MDKPLKDWTLGELKEYCNSTAGAEQCLDGACPFKAVCDYLIEATDCCADAVTPGDWDLSEPPRWTAEDIEDAKAVKRVVFKWAMHVGRGMADIYAHGETVTLQEILDAEEK